MTSKLYLPHIPETPMYIEGIMAIEWQEYFRLLYERVGGTEEETNTELSDRLTATAIELEYLMQAITTGHY